MLKEIFIPNEDHHAFELPKEFYGKKVQVIAYEIVENIAVTPEKEVLTSFWDTVEFNPDFPSLTEIRKIAWR